MPKLELLDGAKPQLNLETPELEHQFRATMTARTFLDLRDRINRFYEKTWADNSGSANGGGDTDNE